MTKAPANFPQLPDHIDPALVRHIDFNFGPGMTTCPHQTLSELRDGPRIFFNQSPSDYPGLPGTWVPTLAEDLRKILGDPGLFTSAGITGFSALLGESWRLIPAELDPPEHTVFRQFLNPLFTPEAVTALDAKIRQRAAMLVDAVAAAGRCEFVTAFSQPFPVGVVLELLGLPLQRLEEFVSWGHQLHHSAGLRERANGATAIAVYLREMLAKRRAEPQDDILSHVANGSVQGRSLTDDEALGVVYLMFIGGVDTMTSELGFQFEHLARHPELQRRLRADATRIPAAVEEMLRMFAPVNSARTITRDVEFAGVQMKAGDRVAVTLPIVNRDPALCSMPDRMDIDRNDRRHMTFSFGPHFCIGAHLARRELAVAVETWMSRLPEFRLGDAPPSIHAGPLLGVDKLELCWD